MKTLLKYCTLIFVGVLFFACNHNVKQHQNEIDLAPLKTEIALEWGHFFEAWVDGNATKSASFFTEDGIHFRPGAAIDSGRLNIENTFSLMLEAFKVEYCRQSTFEIEVMDDKIIEYGTYEQKWVHSEEIMKGSYFAVWKRQYDKPLKISRLIFN